MAAPTASIQHKPRLCFGREVTLPQLWVQVPGQLVLSQAAVGTSPRLQAGICTMSGEICCLKLHDEIIEN